MWTLHCTDFFSDDHKNKTRPKGKQFSVAARPEVFLPIPGDRVNVFLQPCQHVQEDANKDGATHILKPTASIQFLDVRHVEQTDILSSPVGKHLLHVGRSLERAVVVHKRHTIVAVRQRFRKCQPESATR